MYLIQENSARTFVQVHIYTYAVSSNSNMFPWCGVVSRLLVRANGELCINSSIAVRIWDVRPFAPFDRQLKLFQGNQHNFEKVNTVYGHFAYVSWN